MRPVQGEMYARGCSSCICGFAVSSCQLCRNGFPAPNFCTGTSGAKTLCWQPVRKLVFDAVCLVCGRKTSYRTAWSHSTRRTRIDTASHVSRPSWSGIPIGTCAVPSPLSQRVRDACACGYKKRKNVQPQSDRCPVFPVCLVHAAYWCEYRLPRLASICQYWRYAFWGRHMMNGCRHSGHVRVFSRPNGLDRVLPLCRQAGCFLGEVVVF